MANFSITISNVIDVFGEDPSSLWGNMVWGVDNWGGGSRDLTVDVEKFLSNSQSLDSSIVKEPTVLMTEAITFTEDITYEDLRDGNGYLYEFIRPTSNAKDRSITSWTDAAMDTEVYISQAVATTTWSEQ